MVGGVLRICLDQARFVRWRTSLNKEMLVVGGIGGKTTHPAAHSPTNQHLPTCTDPPMQGRLTVTAIIIQQL